MPALSPPSRLQSRAYEELRRLIVSGEFTPGTFLSERQLAQQLAMSKTPVHVALERLESEGFVTISAQQGVVVRSLSVEDIVDHYELRDAIEGWVVRRLSGRLNEGQQTQLHENLNQQEEALLENDFARLTHLDSEMHYLMCSFLNNREIIRTMERLRDKIHLVIHRVLATDPGRPRQSVKEHREIVDAIFSGDGDLAARLMTSHLEAGKRRVLNPSRFSD
ncbi:MAG: GntR family transcriptional regulator [Verrucomicrobiae bacterium]|nr:GntR family transcriptional regulator [Verrucomicrobiae bacterium]